MGIVVHKEQDKNTELNSRITADLRRRAQETSRASDPNFAEDVDYTRNLKKTGRFGWVWIVLIVLAVISLISIVVL